MATSVNVSRPTKRTHRNWDKLILPEVKKRQQYHESQGIPATIRGLLYIFESMGILAKKDYGSLSKHLVEWRESNEIGVDWIVDRSRRIMDIIYYDEKGRRIFVVHDDKLRSKNEIVEPPEHIKCGIDYLRDSAEDFRKNIPKWIGQPKYLEVWAEKDTMAPIIYRILNNPSDENENIRIVVAPNRGWSSHTFAQDNLERLLEQKRNGLEVYVQYYGDSDPTGERMTAEDSDMVKMLRKHGIHFERIAITDDIIRDFEMESIKLASMNDPKTQLKFEGTPPRMGDPNTRWFKERHKTDKAWQIEVDALQLNLPKFRELVLSNARKCFDIKIYKKEVSKFKRKYTIEMINDELKRQVKDFAIELGLNCY